MRLQINVSFAAELAKIAIQSLGATGVRVPEDVAVVGYDDVPFAASFNPPLTTVSQQIALAGVELVSELLEIIGGGRAQNRTLPTSLIILQSA